MFDCPVCGSTRTFATPETDFERFCGDCDATWDQRTTGEDVLFALGDRSNIAKVMNVYGGQPYGD